jgi:hypothetical protein
VKSAILGSTWAGKQLDSFNLKAMHNLLPLAVRLAQEQNQHQFWVNSPDNVVLTAGTVVIVADAVNDIQRAREDSKEDLEPEPISRNCEFSWRDLNP